MIVQNNDHSKVDLSTVSMEELLDKFASGGHKPGSGSASAMQGLMSCALTKTVITLTKARKRYKGNWQKLSEIEDSILNKIEPVLRRSFDEDSKQFDKVILARQRRNDEEDPFERRKAARTALDELQAANEIPIVIAENCMALARHAIAVFDDGFKAARGDSAVAVDSALSGASGAISIVFLNLSSFSGEEYSRILLAKTIQLEEELNTLRKELEKRMSQLRNAAIQSNEKLRLDLSVIRAPKSSEGTYSDENIEKIARNLQFDLWRIKDEILEKGEIENSMEILKPTTVFELLGYEFDEVSSLDRYSEESSDNEIIGFIDKKNKYVAVSRKASPAVRRFTAAHELGHAILHRKNLQFRDRGLDGSEHSRSKLELEADRFAVFFLMPKTLVCEFFNKIFKTDRFEINNTTAFQLARVSLGKFLRDHSDTRDLSLRLASATVYAGRPTKSLAEIFGVSNSAMAIRIEELGLVESID